MKKALKIISILVLLVLIAAVSVPYLLKDKIADIIKTEANKRVNATINFSDINISLFRSFPKASVQIENLSIVNFEPFKGDTLFYANTFLLSMPVNSLFKKDASEIKITNFLVDNSLINVLTNTKGETNTNITKSTNSEVNKTENSDTNIAFSIQKYALTNATINYIDEISKTQVILNKFNHTGSGNLAEEITTLQTETTTNITYKSGETTYLDNHKLDLNANLKLDQNQNKYSFLENDLSINDLKLKFNGYVQIHEKKTEIDLKFNTPTSDFKNFIALIPKQSQHLNGIKTNGSFTISGFVKGIVTETKIPKFNVNITSKNASFKYPNLPKSVTHINLASTLQNTTGNTNDTFVNIDNLSFQIDEDVFKASGKITKIFSKNRYVNAKLDGVLNLGNLSKAYPIELDTNLKGILTANLQTSFSQHALDTNNFEAIKNDGNFTITDFQYASKNIVNPIDIKKATVAFTTKKIKLNSFEAKSGDSDINATGTIDNLFGFLFSEQKLKGNFNVQSKLFKISDFMVDNTTETENTKKQSKTGEALKIPDFLDVKITADAKTVIYDNLTLENVKGKLLIKNETVSLQNMTSQLFEGSMKINGNVSTKNEKPTFNLNLGINNFDIEESLNGMELLESLAPIAKILKGKLNTVMLLSGEIANDFSIQTNSLTGNALAEVETKKVTTKQSKVLSLLDTKLNFIDFSKLDLKDLKAALSFKNGKVTLKPFQIQYDDISIQVAGTHGFDQVLNYTATFNVPAKYFGNQAGNLLSKLSDADIKNVKVPILVNITGNMLNPKINTDLKKSMTNLTKQLIQIQKNKLQQQTNNAINDVIDDTLGNILGNKKNDISKDSTQTTNPKDIIKDATKNVVKDVLGGFFGKKKK